MGLDFGQFTLDNGDRIRLFGTPGQSRFDFLWKILSKNALGMIILADNSRPDPLGDLRAQYLEGFADDLDIMPCAIGIGRLADHRAGRRYINELARHWRAAVLEVDVRKRDDVILLIDTLLAQLKPACLENKPMSVKINLAPSAKVIATREAEKMLSEVDGVTAVVIATLDGFDVASAMRHGDPARVAAMASSISAISSVVSQEAAWAATKA